MEIGVQATGDYEHLLRVAAITEASSATALAFADHYLFGSEPAHYTSPVHDSLVQAAALGRDTSRVELVMLVSPITFRHPAVYAKAALSIDDLSDGRFVLGLGTGWHEDEHTYHGIEYPDATTRFEWLDEALAYVRTYFDTPQEGFTGRHYRFTGFDSHPRARRHGRRLLTGGSGGVKTPTLAGTYCDEFNVYHHTASGVAARLAVMREAAVRAGRDPDDILISTCLPVLGGDTEDEVVEAVRSVAASRALDPDLTLERWRAAPGIHVGTWEQHRDFIGGLAELGIERTYLQLAAGADWHLERALAELT